MNISCVTERLRHFTYAQECFRLGHDFMTLHVPQRILALKPDSMAKAWLLCLDNIISSALFFLSQSQGFLCLVIMQVGSALVFRRNRCLAE